MKIIYKAPRGTRDILPNETKIWQKIREIAIKVSEKFGFFEIMLPTFEDENLFTRSVGEETDVVKKEMFRFSDQSGRKLALRPEGTACAVRAIIEHGLLNKTLPLKIFYIINCFRNERPQAGRFKEFYQFGVELFGSKEPVAELEIISLANMFFKELEIDDLALKINSIGCENCRKDYILKLTKYFEKYKEEICPICQNRLVKNPLRLLDCKQEKCQEIKKNAPSILDSLCSLCSKHFKTVCDLLNFNSIAFKIDKNIVRGLDYYTRTVFEFETKKLGSQSAVCGGGRYDNLIENLGATKTPALGFAVGLNRLVMLLKEKEKENYCDLFIGNIGEKELFIANKIANSLRKNNIKVQTDLLKKSVKSQMKYANKINAKFSLIIGEKELEEDKVVLKSMFDEKNFTLNLNTFEEEFIKILS